jgi:phosphate uptake regulator
MELRKVQVTGGTTHVLSLPKKWVDRNGIERHSLVAIHEESDGSLLLVPHGAAPSPDRKVTLDIEGNVPQSLVVRRLVGAYIAGVDEITVRSTGRLDDAVREAVRGMTRHLVGVEIVEETKQTLVLQDLMGVSDMDLRKSITRMNRMARLMFDDALGALLSGDAKQAQAVASRDDEVDRLYWMVSKQMHAVLERPRLAADLDIEPAGALNHFLVARTTERMADHATKIAGNALLLRGHELPAEVRASLNAQAEVVRGIWDDAFAAMAKGDFALGARTAESGEAAEAWRAAFSAQILGLARESVGPMALVADSLDRIRGYAVDVAETAMNHTFVAPRPVKSG